MDGKKYWNGIWLFLGMVTVLGVITLTGRLYWGYLGYGEQGKVQSDIDGNSESDTSEEVFLMKMEEQPQIRVCIRTSDYKETVHQKVEITSSGDFTVERLGAVESIGTNEKIYQAGDVICVKMDDMAVGDVMRISSLEEQSLIITNIIRAQGTPEYDGILHLCRTMEGILLINELPLENYLYSVVASEMPSAYPEEAQKAQAVCARTYAVNCMKNRKYAGDFEQVLEQWKADDWQNPRYLWDLDDSVEFQVYNNQEAAPASQKAVQATEGEILDLSEVLYYSTSAGSEHRTDLNEETAFAAFLAEEPEPEAEYGSPWLRWQVELSEASILSNLAEKNKEDLKKIIGLEIIGRNEQGQVQKLKITGETGSLVIEGEYQIRKILAPQQEVIYLRDGTVVDGMSMLPSAYFVTENPTVKLETEELQRDQENVESDNTDAGGFAEEASIASFMIHGGGYGHGIGMSQYGAASMAQSGCDYREILEYYYAATVF